ncbi:MAG: MW1434 family type I TA system toxin [Pseudomonadota bacterium]
MRFSDALNHLQSGHKVRRPKWHARMYLKMDKAEHWRPERILIRHSPPKAHPAWQEDPKAKEWEPAQRDILQTDWVLID